MKALFFLIACTLTVVVPGVAVAENSDPEITLNQITLTNRVPGWNGLVLGMSLKETEVLTESIVQFPGRPVPSTCGTTVQGFVDFKAKKLALFFSGSKPDSTLQAMDIPYERITEESQKQLSLKLVKQFPFLIDMYPNGNNSELFLYMLPKDDRHTISISRYGINLNSCGLAD